MSDEAQETMRGVVRAIRLKEFHKTNTDQVGDIDWLCGTVDTLLDEREKLTTILSARGT